MKISLVDDYLYDFIYKWKQKKPVPDNVLTLAAIFKDWLREKQTEINEQIDRDYIPRAKTREIITELKTRLFDKLGIKPSECQGNKAKVDFSPEVENQEQGGGG